MSKQSHWRVASLRDEQGIVVASDKAQEWLLPWWWERYSRFNSLPVAFVDLGLSPRAQEWCRARGELVPLSVADLAVAGRDEVEPELAADWELRCGKGFWAKRRAFFQKPFACLQSPFRQSIWIDTDCEIRGPISELFNFLDRSSGVSLSVDQVVSGGGSLVYNSGVIVFNHGIPLLKEWAERSLLDNRLFLSDQDLLSHLIVEKGYPVTPLPSIYHWSHYSEDNLLARIVHWHGEGGKRAIRRQIN